MSHWNTHQYQDPNMWEGDSNQYQNQRYGHNHNNQTPNITSDQYVGFNQFLSQMQNGGPSTTAHRQTPTDQCDNIQEHQALPQPTNNKRHTAKTSKAPSSNTGDSVPVPSTSVNSDILKKSNLTPTAVEFVPKNVRPMSCSYIQQQPNSSTYNGSYRPRKPRHEPDTNWRERPTIVNTPNAPSNGETDDSQQNGHGNPSHEPGPRKYEGKYNNSNQGQQQDNRSDTSKYPRNKGKSREERTYYSSKSTHDVRGGRADGPSNRKQNWAGSQRLRSMDVTSPDDEQFANNYLKFRDEKQDRGRGQGTSSPVKAKNKNTANRGSGSNNNNNKEQSQRERLSEQLDAGTLECLVCCERVRPPDSVWHCANCYHVLHLRCVRKWATSSVSEGKWRCPACQNATAGIPSEYRCMCGAVRNPEWSRGGGAHTCGGPCARARACVHPCVSPCHPGPCAPCQATVTKQCGCGAETRAVLCSSKLPQVCERACGRPLPCGRHACARTCHEGACDECEETIEQVCHCPAAKTRAAACGAGDGYSCGEACARVLPCGAHVCRGACHAPPCAPCERAPENVVTCPCGNMKIPIGQRKKCTDPVPLCGNICAKPLPCGPAGDHHFCKIECHEGPCPPCPDRTALQCRCGHTAREVACADAPALRDSTRCQRKCNKKLSCGRHRCRALCCADAAHRCGAVCGRSLSCQQHRCERLCHTGHCAPCPVLGWSELRCACGAEALLPPVACGARAPACQRDCARARPCGHAPHHACHEGACPPCVVLTARRCHGDHEERKTIPCSQEGFSCGLPCGRPLPCGRHRCLSTCHAGPCDAATCTQPCAERRPRCGHACGAPCHAAAGGACPSAAPCRVPVRAACRCDRRALQRACSENAAAYNKMVGALAAARAADAAVDLSDLSLATTSLKTLECDEECLVEARTRRMALALQIRNPDVGAKLAPRYGDAVRAWAQRDAAFVAHVHDRLTELVQLAKQSKQKTRSHSFPSMNWQKRQLVHELCTHFGCESVAYDAEPNRNVVATADREKSWLPAMSVLEVLSREAGRRRVPGPVLRAAAPPATKQQTSSWSTLTSTNAWASRSKTAAPAASSAPAAPAAAPAAGPSGSRAPPAPKIDYFDNPPE